MDVETKSMTFDFQPTLKGKLLELRPLRASDFRDLYAVASDSLIWEQHAVKDRCKEDVFKGFFQEALDSGGALIAIDSKASEVIGSSRFHGYDEQESEIEIGWTFLSARKTSVRREQWRKLEGFESVQSKIAVAATALSTELPHPRSRVCSSSDGYRKHRLRSKSDSREHRSVGLWFTSRR